MTTMYEQRAAIPSAFLDVEIGSGIPGRVRSATWLFVTGPVGSGKSHLAAQLMRVWLAKAEEDYEQSGSAGWWESIPVLAAAIQSSYRDGGPLSKMERSLLCRRVVLDDLGAEKPTDDVVAKIGALIDARWANRRTTITTSNLTLDQIAATYGDRIASRLASGTVHKTTGKDRRIDK